MRRHISTVLIPVVALACLSLMTAAGGAQEPGGSAAGKALKNPVASSPESIAAGKATYQKNCRFCHGDDAKGNGPMAPKARIRRTSPTPSGITDRPTARSSPSSATASARSST